ncbi:hypothetical protein ACH51_19585 (plasmid) [Ralstonia solanacearum]|nr:hypothetical protein ACH51_19585 [Ralstonia solanacearum]
MMKYVGFDGGHSIYELGLDSDLVLFFDCLRAYGEQAHPEQGWSLLKDRLYRRYLRLEELDKALTLMEQAQQIFAQHTGTAPPASSKTRVFGKGVPASAAFLASTKAVPMFGWPANGISRDGVNMRTQAVCDEPLGGKTNVVSL